MTDYFLRRIWFAGLRACYERLYGPWARAYDPLSAIVSLGRWRTWQQAALPFLTGRRVLEVGFGPGHLLVELRRAGFIAVGLDSSPQMAHLAADRLRRHGLPAAVVRGRSQALPLAAGTFDCVLLTFPTALIAETATQAEIARVLRPGGRLIVVEDARFLGRTAPERLLNLAFGLTSRPLDPALGEGLAAAGFAIERRVELVAGSAVDLLCAVRDRSDDNGMRSALLPLPPQHL